MQLRKVELIPIETAPNVVNVKADDETLYCWKSECRLCSSDCAAWRISGNILMCMALPTDKRIAQIINAEKENDN